MKDKLTPIAVAAGSLGIGAALAEQAEAKGTYTAVCRGAKEGCMEEYVALLDRIAKFEKIGGSALARIAPPLRRWAFDKVAKLREEAEPLTEVKWTETFDNLVTTVGKNYLLDNGLAGSAYTAAFFMGLISLVSYSAVAVGDTQASHAGWLEAGATNAPTYSGARKTAAWSAASAGSKALSAGLVFTFTGSGTVKGCFLTTVSTVDGTTGTLYSAGLFTGGDQPVVSTNTLTVSYTASL